MGACERPGLDQSHPEKSSATLLTTALSDQVTFTCARASTSYGEHVARDLAMGMADEERVIVSGGAYGIEGTAHQAALAAPATRSRSWPVAWNASARPVTVSC